MNTFRIYQVIITPEMCDDVNRLGHSGGGDLHPEYKTYLDLSLGAKRYVPEMFKHFKLVAEIEADDLEHAFHIGNVERDNVNYIEKYATSISVGNIVFDVNEEEYYICDMFGWERIEVQ